MNGFFVARARAVKIFLCFAFSGSLVIALGGLSGCAQLGHKDRAHRLDRSVQLYVDSIRWGNFDTAAALTRVREGQQPPLDDSKLGNLRVTAYSSRVLSIDQTTGEARVTAQFDYYFLDSGTVRNVSQTALWYFDEATQSWFLDGGLPEFRR